MAKRKRAPIPPEISARVLFESDRTCCVCRQRGKPVQIHHINENPSHNDLRNLAVLCFDCHRETQITGGFDRKLDSDQVTLYRNDWHEAVARARTKTEALAEQTQNRGSLELATSLAEIYRENKQFELLAMHYHSIGNGDLRDKYIEQVLAEDPDDSTVMFLRGLQNRPDLIPEDVATRQLDKLADLESWSQRARANCELGRYKDACLDYLRDIQESLRDNRFFSATYYLRELAESPITKELLVLALKQAQDEGDLWWQVRSLQELGWWSELRELLLSHADEIESGDEALLRLELLRAQGKDDDVIALRKEMAKHTRIAVLSDDDSDEDAQPTDSGDTQ
jgi:hypothetical protein